MQRVRLETQSEFNANLVDTICAGKRVHYFGGVDAIYFYLSGVTVFFTILISSVLIFFVIKYRRRSPFEIPRPIAGSHKLETLWSVIPLIIAMSMFAWGAQIYSKIRARRRTQTKFTW